LVQSLIVISYFLAVPKSKEFIIDTYEEDYAGELIKEYDLDAMIEETKTV
jgi:hypothetical protein